MASCRLILVRSMCAISQLFYYRPQQVVHECRILPLSRAIESTFAITDLTIRWSNRWPCCHTRSRQWWLSLFLLDREDSQEANASGASLAVVACGRENIRCPQKPRAPAPTRWLLPVKHQNVFGLPFTGLAYCHGQGF